MRRETQRGWGAVNSGAFDSSSGFSAGVSSARERRNADLFLLEWNGGFRREGRGWSRQRASLISEQVVPGTASVDLGITEELALLVADHAPLPVTSAEIRRAARDSGIRDDYKSVSAWVPASPDSRVFMFLHGNNHSVPVARVGDVPAAVDPSRHSRVPRWADDRGRSGALRKKSALLYYRFDELSSSQAAFTSDVIPSGAATKAPVVLVPEDAEISDSDDFWSVPPRGQYTSATRLQDLVAECYERLRRLSTPSGRQYLSPRAQSAAFENVGRIYLSGHSGGGMPLVEAAGSTLVTARPTDLWLYDCTYRFGVQNYIEFCRTWQRAGRLGNRSDAARFVCIYRPRNPYSNTETVADNLRESLAPILGVSAASLLRVHGQTDLRASPDLTDVVTALCTQPVTFIRTQVAHELIPTLFTPLLLRTASS